MASTGQWCTDAEYIGFKNELIRQDGGQPRCFYCKRKIDLRLTLTSSEAYTIDHLKPKARFPELTKVVSNMVSAHKSCNSSKGLQTMEKVLADMAMKATGTRPEWDPPEWVS